MRTRQVGHSTGSWADLGGKPLSKASYLKPAVGAVSWAMLEKLSMGESQMNELHDARIDVLFVPLLLPSPSSSCWYRSSAAGSSLAKITLAGWVQLHSLSLVSRDAILRLARKGWT